jgi:hypothetical protein
MNLYYLHEQIIKMKLNQFSLKIRLILFHIKHFYQEKSDLASMKKKIIIFLLMLT